MKNGQITIAVTGIGAPLGQSMIRAALLSQRHYRVIGMDVHSEEQAIFPEIEYCQAVHINSDDYCLSMVESLRTNSVDLLLLGSEREMLGILPIKKQIQQETNCRIAISEEAALRTGMDKLSTVELLRSTGLPYPRTYSLSEDWNTVRSYGEEIGYPCIAKGRRAGVPIIVRNEDDLSYCFRNCEDYIIQEFLGDAESQEYTVGLFYAPEYGVTDTFCMKRLLKYGLTWRGGYAPHPEIEEMASKAVAALSPKGSVNVQLREHNGTPVIHEFNVRCSSTTVFRAMAGWNEIDMAVDYFVYNRKPDKPQEIRAGTGIRFFQETWIDT